MDTQTKESRLLDTLPLTIETLNPFPLPKNLENLPPSTLNEFIQLYDLVSGYIKSLESFTVYQNSLLDQLNQQISKLNEIIEIFKEYEKTSELINKQIITINTTFNEFVNLETYQYQLLSSNFNQDFLKKKFIRVIEENNEHSNELISDFKSKSSNGKSINDEEFHDFILRLRNDRKTYHLRKEKLNRWNEERVSGFI